MIETNRSHWPCWALSMTAFTRAAAGSSFCRSASKAQASTTLRGGDFAGMIALEGLDELAAGETAVESIDQFLRERLDLDLFSGYGDTKDRAGLYSKFVANFLRQYNLPFRRKLCDRHVLPRELKSYPL